MSMTSSEVEIGRIGEELFELWAATDMMAASLIGRVPERIGMPMQSDSDQATSKARGWATRLEAVRRDGLSPATELTRRYLRFEVGKLLDGGSLHRFNLQITPYHIGGTLAEVHRHAQSFAFEVMTDLERYTSLLEHYRAFLAGTLQNLREQFAMGILVPASALPGCLGVIKGLANSFEQYWSVAPERLARITDARRNDFLTQTERAIEQARAAFNELIQYIEGDYTRRAPQTVGLSQYTGGHDAYEMLIRHHTSFAWSAEEVQRRGVELVREIEEDMARVRGSLGFSGSGREFLEHIKKDPRLYCSTPDAVDKLYLGLMQRFEAKMPQAFGARAFAPYGVKRLPPEAEGGMTFGYYQAPAVHGDSTGYYVYNGSNLDQRPMIGAASLIYHELVPGHHLHISAEMGNAARPLARRLPTITAFNEGWAEYAADLGFELGLYEDPYDRYGRHLLQVFTASRLVVDTGLNALGWTLQQARDYMLEHTAQSATEVESEVLRYSSGMPAQALAYAPGRQHFWQVRRDAERRLGSRFDLPAFHGVILEGGSLPLPDVSFSVEQWVALI
jgi:uncharacterized protein (DUF885 family)